MQTEGSVAPPQLSPDGHWWWDGASWLPAPVRPADPAGPDGRPAAAPLPADLPDGGPSPAPAPEPGTADLLDHAHDPALPSDSFASLAAAPVPRQASPFAEFTAPPALDLPVVTAPYQPPAYQADVYQPVPVRSVESPGRTLGLVSLVCSIVGLSLPAVVLGHVSRGRDRAAGMPPNGLALAGIVLGYVVMALVLLGIVAAVAVPTFLAHRMRAENASVVSQLTGAAAAQGTIRASTGRYSSSVQDLVEAGYSPDPTVQLDVLSAGSTSYCLRALKPSRSDQPMYADSTGSVGATACA